jgi:hypothetical protein
MKKRIELLLGQLKGVVSVSTSGSSAEELTIHVLATAERPEQLIQRDCRSALIARLNLRITPDRIAVIPLAGACLQDMYPVRAELVSVQVYCNSDLQVAKVILAYKDRQVEGVAQTATREPGLRAVAEATIQAIHRGLKQNKGVFHIEHVYKARTAQREVVLAAVELRTRGMSRQLLGAAYISVSEHQAAAQAVLDAVNRQFERPLK